MKTNSPVKAPLTAPQTLKMLVLIVNRAKADFYTDLLAGYEANLQFSLQARGTADRETLALLGLADSEKAVLCALVREEMIPPLLDTLEEKFKVVKNGKGVAAVLPLSSMIGASVYRFLCNNRTIGDNKQ